MNNSISNNYKGDEPPDIHYKKGMQFLVSGNHDSALIEMKKSIDLDPNYFNPYSIIGSIKGMQGKYEEALEWIEKALKLKPEEINSLYNKALMFKKLFKFDEAKQIVKKCLNIDPKHVGALTLEGVLLMNEKKFNEALNSFNKALKEDPTNQVAQINKKSVLTQLEKFEDLKDFNDESKIERFKEQFLNVCDFIYQIHFEYERFPGAKIQKNLDNLEQLANNLKDSLGFYIYGDEGDKNIKNIFPYYIKFKITLQNDEAVLYLPSMNYINNKCLELYDLLKEFNSLGDVKESLEKTIDFKELSTPKQELKEIMHSLGAMIKNMEVSKTNPLYQVMMEIVDLLGKGLYTKHKTKTLSNITTPEIQPLAYKYSDLKEKSADELNINESDLTGIKEFLDHIFLKMKLYSPYVMIDEKLLKPEFRSSKAKQKKELLLFKVGEEFILNLCTLVTILNNKKDENEKFKRFMELYWHLFNAIGYYIYGDNEVLDLALYYYEILNLPVADMYEYSDNPLVYDYMTKVQKGLINFLEPYNIIGKVNLKGREFYKLSDPNIKITNLKLCICFLGDFIDNSLMSENKKHNPIYTASIELLEDLGRILFSKNETETVDELLDRFMPKLNTLKQSTAQELKISEKNHMEWLTKLEKIITLIRNC